MNLLPLTLEDLANAERLEQARTPGKWEFCCKECLSLHDPVDDRKLMFGFVDWENEGEANCRWVENATEILPRLLVDHRNLLAFIKQLGIQYERQLVSLDMDVMQKLLDHLRETGKS